MDILISKVFSFLNGRGESPLLWGWRPYLGLCVLMVPAMVAARIVVPDDVPTVQSAITRCAAGDTVLVMPGTYYESIDFQGRNIVVGSQYLLDNDPAWISMTIIHGLSGTSVVTFTSGEDSTAALIGLTVTGGTGTHINPYGDDLWVHIGGGIFCHKASPRLEALRIFGNETEDWAGGVFLWETACTLTDVVVTENSSRVGGGIMNWVDADTRYKRVIIRENQATSNGGICIVDSDPLFKETQFRSNTAITFAGGIGLVNSNAVFIQCEICDNSVEDGAGGGVEMMNYGGTGTPLFRQTVFVGNSSRHGGAIFGDNGTQARLENVTIFGNSATTSGGGICCYASELENCIVYGNDGGEIFAFDENALTIKYCCVAGGWPGEGNIDVDPLFRDPMGDNPDLHLMSTDFGWPADSPCIDTGNPSYIDATLSEFWGLGCLRADMGAYGGHLKSPSNVPATPASPRIELAPNHPNPFNPHTTISYSLPEAAKVLVAIYDLKGRLVDVLQDSPQTAGQHTLVWDGKDHPSGTYLCRLMTEGEILTLKMTLLK